ncbi:MAG: PadR family transcriptional regulator, partial [Gemmatimonadetes bacterium]|nr:PadR family transcriptional regulator [Gemmatimonadota bacterium]
MFNHIVVLWRRAPAHPERSRHVSHLGEFEQLVLFSLLHLSDQAYGVSIRDAIEERTGRAVSSGAIYTVLGRLEERRLV